MNGYLKFPCNMSQGWMYCLIRYSTVQDSTSVLAFCNDIVTMLHWYNEHHDQHSNDHHHLCREIRVQNTKYHISIIIHTYLPTYLIYEYPFTFISWLTKERQSTPHPSIHPYQHNTTYSTIIHFYLPTYQPYISRYSIRIKLRYFYSTIQCITVQHSTRKLYTSYL